MLFKGLFWQLSPDIGDLVTVKFPSDANGVLCDTAITSKDINHKRIWATLDSSITGGHPYNYYPRGRVELRHGRAIIFCSPYICTDKLKAAVTAQFGLTADNGITDVTLKADGSAHYQCALDTGE